MFGEFIQKLHRGTEPGTSQKVEWDQPPWAQAHHPRWDELADQRFPEEGIAPLVFRPWYEAVLKWATGPVEPTKISAAPRPEEFVPGQIATA